MANEQLALYDVPPIPPKQENKQKKSWEDGFQKWSNESAQDEGNEGNPIRTVYCPNCGAKMDGDGNG